MHLHLPGGFGIRVDTHIYAGYTVPPHYDAMIAKLIVQAQSREEAIARMKSAFRRVRYRRYSDHYSLSPPTDG